MTNRARSFLIATRNALDAFIEFSRTNRILVAGIGGIIPFVVFLLGALNFGESGLYLNFFMMMQMMWSSIVLAFLCGVHWPFAVHHHNNRELVLSLIPVVLLLPLTIAALVGYADIAFGGVALLFIYMFFVDRRYLKPPAFPGNYMFQRLALTVTVVLLLCLTIWAFYD